MEEKHATHTSMHTHEHVPGMGHGSARDFLKRFWIVTAFLVPLVLLEEKVVSFSGFPYIEWYRYIQFAIATIIFGFGLVFIRHAVHEIRARKYGMMTLVSVAVIAGYGFSAVATFVSVLEAGFYLEISTLIWVLLFGHYLEAKSGAAAGDALSEVQKLLPAYAHLIGSEGQEDVPIEELREGDKVRVRPGEKIPADGRIVDGSAHVNESLISGESKPVEKTEGDDVVAGSICVDGALTIQLTKVGDASVVGQIKQLIQHASETKPRSQSIADTAAAVLTFIAIFVALTTLLVWTFVIGKTFVFALTLAITVLVIACPHALGLAIPTVTTISTSLAVKNGIFIKDLSKIEKVRSVDYVVFDKTGTLTEGVFEVIDIVPQKKNKKEDVVAIAASLEVDSSHIIAQAVRTYAEQEGIEMYSVSEFKNIAGQGIRGVIDGQNYFVGNEKLLTEQGISVPSVNKKDATAVFVADNTECLGYIFLADKIKESAYTAIDQLHALGVSVAMITGDNDAVAARVADELGIDTYFARVAPEDKYTHIRALQNDGHTVLMAGDGINDAPALMQADVGVAIGAGTDVAIEAGDAVLTGSDPAAIARFIKLSRKVYAKMVQNLVWALGYNVVAIPAAAGVFAPWGFFLRPEIGALVMSVSTVIVVLNALTLKRIRL